MPVRRRIPDNSPSLAELIGAQGGVCFYCRKPFSKSKMGKPSRDHLFPRSMGCDLKDNRVVACVRCNGAKGDRMPTPEEVERAQALYERFGSRLRYRMEPVEVVTHYRLVKP